jgi:FeS assembly SUF system regulator
LVVREEGAMLRLSKLTDYGTVITAHMAREPERVFAAAELAAASGVGVPTASKILKALARAALLHSVRGAKGGYLLARPAGEISLAQVINALEGPLGITECSARAGLCAQEGSCAIRSRWQAIDQVIRHALDETTLADMARPLPPQLPSSAAAPVQAARHTLGGR